LAIRKVLAERILPPPVNDKRCEHCSLRESCMPSVIDERDRVGRVLSELFSATPL
jgi:CRISPR-associated exonuclease Cas4